MATVFISYSWDNQQHKDWVLSLAKKLHADHITVKLDQLDLRLGDELTQYMETSIRDSDKVLIICTPVYKTKSDNRLGGVGYEESIITGEVFNNRNNRKFIPLLRKGTWKDAAPTWLTSKVYTDFSSETFDEEKYKELLQNITDFKNNSMKKVNTSYEGNATAIDNTDNEDISIKGIIVDEVTVPKMDGTRGSALYAIPFKLSKRPTSVWTEAFINSWQSPPEWSSMHRFGIARVYGDKIILDGTTIEEVEQYHKKTLLLCVKIANTKEREYFQRKAYLESLEQQKTREHQQNVMDNAKKIKFD